MRYDPAVPPDAARWLESDEPERLDAVLRHHKRARQDSGSPRMHAAIHVTVETQLAEGLDAAVRAMDRLREQGLGRHDAVHAIGSVVAEQMFAAVQGGEFDAAAYSQKLDVLSAESWRKSYEDD